MVDKTKIPAGVFQALRDRGHSDASIKRVTGRGAFFEFCWANGLIGWSDTLWENVTTLAALDKPQPSLKDQILALQLAISAESSLQIRCALQDDLDEALVVLKAGSLSSANQFSVIGHDENTRELFVEHVIAEDGLQAFAAAATRRPDGEFSAAVSGHLSVGDGGIVLPGESLVCAETVRDQLDVFGEVPEVDGAFKLSR